MCGEIMAEVSGVRESQARKIRREEDRVRML